MYFLRTETFSPITALVVDLCKTNQPQRHGVKEPLLCIAYGFCGSGIWSENSGDDLPLFHAVGSLKREDSTFFIPMCGVWTGIAQIWAKS